MCVFGARFNSLSAIVLNCYWSITICSIFTAVLVLLYVGSADLLFPLHPSPSLRAAGSKAATVEFSNSMCEMGSPVSSGPQQVVQLAEDLKLALELQSNQEERETLRAQLPEETAQALLEWLQTTDVSTFD